MLRINKISAGAGGVEYLLRATDCAEHDHASHTRDAAREDASSRGAEYMLRGAEHGEAKGVWHGKGLEMLGVQAGTEVDPDVMRAVYGRLEHPVTGESLGNPPRNYDKVNGERLEAALAAEPTASEERQAEIRRAMERKGIKPTGFYDVTVSPSKSASVYRAALEAAGEFELADAMDAAHRQANKEMLEFLERNVTLARVGRHETVKSTGKTVGEYAEIKGLIITSWEHSSSREGDPHSHIHNAVLNRVQTKDGKIYTVDGQAFKPLKGEAAMLYERRYAELVTEATGARWGLRPDGKAREILGVSSELCKDSSRRAKQVAGNLEKLVEDYRDTHGREPSRHAMAKMRRYAWADGRKTKSPLSPAAHHDQYVQKHGRNTLTDVVASVKAAAARVEREGHPDKIREFASENDLVKAAVEKTQGLHAAWDETALALELNKLVGDVSWGKNTEAEIQRLVTKALDPEGPAGVLPLVGKLRAHVPDALRHAPGGGSIYAPKRGIMYATREHMSAEQQLLGEASLIGGPVLTKERAADVLEALKTTSLHPDQRNAIMGVLTSGRASDVLIGPAGTGKSFTVGMLDATWRAEFGAPVMGVATSQKATNVLREEGLDALNTSKFLAEFAPGPDGRAPKQVLPRGVALIVDEAGMADTKHLAQIAKLVRAAGGKMLYTGDDAQLAAVGPGGILRLLANDTEPYVLGEVQRFKKDPTIHDVDPTKTPLSGWEGEASLRLRDGDVSVLGVYEQHGRFRAGDKAEMSEAAMRGYLADIIAGRESVLVVRDNDEAAELSAQIRAELVALGKVDGEVLADLSDTNQAGLGDQVQARLNLHRVDATDGEMLVNREILTVVGMDDQGRLRCQRSGSDAVVSVPRSYFVEHMTLAYANTVHAVQGRTVDTAHAVVDRGWIRNGLYVALTRGRYSNIAYGITEVAPDMHDPERYSAGVSDLMREILSSDGSTMSAIEYYRTQLEAADSLEQIAPLWSLVTRDAMADRHHDVLLDAVGTDQLDVMLKENGHERLLATLQHVELSGYDVPTVVQHVLRTGDRPLDAAQDMSAALAYRVRTAVDERGQRPVPGAWRHRTAATPGTRGEFIHELSELMDQRADMMARSAVLAPPEWALAALGPIPPEDDERARLGWTERVAAIGTYREMTGMKPDQMGIGSAPSRAHDPVRHVAWTRAWEALGRPVEQADHHTATVDELRERVKQWETEKAWAPVYVASELQKSATLAEEYRRESTLAWANVAAEMPADQRHLVGEAQLADQRVAEQRVQLANVRAQLALNGEDPVLVQQLDQARELISLYGSAAATAWAEVAANAPDSAAEFVASAQLADRQFARFAEATRRYERLQEAREKWADRTTEQADAAAVAARELRQREEPLVTPQPEVEQLAMFEVRDEQLVLPEHLDPAYEALRLDDDYVLPDEPDFDEPDFEQAYEVEPEPGYGEPEIGLDSAGVPADETIEIPNSVAETVVDDELDIPLPPEPDHELDQAERDKETVEAQVDIVVEDERDEDAEVVHLIEPELADQEADKAAEVEARGNRGEQDAVRGDFGTEFRLGMVPETDVQYPQAEVHEDPNQLSLVELEPTPAQRVSVGRVRPEVDMTVREAETRADLDQQGNGAADMAKVRSEKQAADAEAERRRQERQREDRDSTRGADRAREQATAAAVPKIDPGREAMR
ncbi:MobF family relaxase [Amycolatopsis thailandensis]|uniref:MobF family relaxase n=1 Tax=Amycolatopsis thailandensis TaxID=589330 RepID=UPI003628EC47